MGRKFTHSNSRGTGVSQAKDHVDTRQLPLHNAVGVADCDVISSTSFADGGMTWNGAVMDDSKGTSAQEDLVYPGKPVGVN